MNDDDENDISTRPRTRANRAQNMKISISNYDDFNFIVTIEVMEIFQFSSTIFPPLYSKRLWRAARFEGRIELRSCSEPRHCLNVCNKMNCWGWLAFAFGFGLDDD